MSRWIEEKIRGYYDWLYNNTSFSQDELTGWYSIQTPFVGLMNDCIEVFVKKEGNKILLSDDGDTISNLELCGVNVSRSTYLTKVLRKIELSFGVTIKDNEITSIATESDFNMRKHALICAIQQISDLKAPGRKSNPVMLAQDVRAYLDEHEVIYTPDFIIAGKRLNFSFDFQIAGRKEEMVIKAFNTLHQSSATSFLFGIEEIRKMREEQTGKGLKSLVIVNDPPKDNIVSALEDYDCNLALWNENTLWKKDLFDVA